MSIQGNEAVDDAVDVCCYECGLRGAAFVGSRLLSDGLRAVISRTLRRGSRVESPFPKPEMPLLTGHNALWILPVL